MVLFMQCLKAALEIWRSETPSEQCQRQIIQNAAKEEETKQNKAPPGIYAIFL